MGQERGNVDANGNRIYTFRVINEELGYLREAKVFKETRICRDQFGREWAVTFEPRSQAPCGLAQASFPQPLGIPPKYLAFDPRRPYDLFIDFERWIGDLKVDTADWKRQCEEYAEKLYGEKAGAAEPTERVLELAGAPPTPWKLIALYQAADQFLTGKVPTPTAAVRHVAPDWLEVEEARAYAQSVREESARKGPGAIPAPTHHLDAETIALLNEQKGPAKKAAAAAKE